MNSSDFRNMIATEMINKDVVMVEDGDIAHIIYITVMDILQTYLDSITDGYLSDRKLSLLKWQISELSDNLSSIVTPPDLLAIWMSMDKVIDSWEKRALEEELYEGLINLKKLRDMV